MFTGIPALRQAIDRHPLVMAPDTSLMQAMATLQSKTIPGDCILVVAQEQLLGIFTSQALIPWLVAQRNLAEVTLAEAMLPSLSIHETDLEDVNAVLHVMQQQPAQLLPVLDVEHRVVGILTPFNLLQSLPLAGSNKVDPLLDGNELGLEDWSHFQQTQRALQQSQQRYQILVNSLKGIVWEADPQTFNLTFVSQQAEAILGYSTADWLTPSFWSDHLHPEDRTPTFEACLKATQLKQDHDLEYRMISLDGRIVWFYDTVRVVTEPDGSVKLVGFMIETTQQQQMQSQLQEQEQVYRVLVENSPDIIERFDTQLRHLYVSPLLTQITGLPVAAFLGKTCRDMDMPEPMVCRWESAAQRLLATGEKQLIEFETPTTNGVRSFEMAIAPELTTDHEIHSILCISRDITDRKHTEAALQEQQQFTEQIAESTLAILYIYDLEENRNVYVNGQVEAVLGYSPAEVQAMGNQMFSTLLHPDDLANLRDSFQRCLATHDGDIVETEYRMRHKEAGYRWLLSRDRVLNRTADGTPRQMLGVATDITPLKATQAALQQQAERERLVGAIAQRVRQSLNLETILATTVAEVRQFLHTDRVIIYRFEQNWSGVVVAESVHGNWLSILHREITDHYFVETQGQTYHQGTIKATADVLTAGYNPCHVELMQQLQVRAKLIVPILQGEHLWGLLVAHHCVAPRSWQPWEGELLSQLATQVGIAIQQANLYNQAQHELTERRQTEVALRLSQARFAGILDVANDAIISIDRTQRITLFNQGAEQIFGYRVEEVLGHPLHVLLPERFAVPHQNCVETFAQGADHARRMGERQEIFARRKNGDEFPAEASISKLTLAGETLFTVILRDISDRKAAETALQCLNRDLEQRVQNRTEALQQQAHQERLLRFITQHIHQSFNLDDILVTVLAETRQTLQSNRVALYRFNPDWSGSFVAESVEAGWVPLVGPIERVWEDTHLQVTQGGRYRYQETFSVEDIYEAGFTRCHIELLEQFQARAFAIAPIFVQDTLWGLLAAYQNAEPRHWQPWDMDLLQQISLQTAIAIQKSELYTRLKNELRHKEVLIKEVHHRVKNNLQVISSLLNLQSAAIDNPDILQPFIESQRRIDVMALIHERLYRSGNLARLNFSDYIRELVEDVFQSYLPIGLMVTWQVMVADLDLELDIAIPCGLIVNELVSNAIKYAFPEGHSGQISITFEDKDTQYVLIIRDDGVGFPAEIDFQNTESLGMQVVCALTRQLGGSITLSQEQGTVFTIIFPSPCTPLFNPVEEA